MERAPIAGLKEFRFGNRDPFHFKGFLSRSIVLRASAPHQREGAAKSYVSEVRRNPWLR